MLLFLCVVSLSLSLPDPFSPCGIIAVSHPSTPTSSLEYLWLDGGRERHGNGEEMSFSSLCDSVLCGWMSFSTSSISKTLTCRSVLSPQRHNWRQSQRAEELGCEPNVCVCVGTRSCLIDLAKLGNCVCVCVCVCGLSVIHI